MGGVTHDALTNGSTAIACDEILWLLTCAREKETLERVLFLATDCCRNDDCKKIVI